MISCDIIVVGGGIVGATIAAMASDAGRRVMLLEAATCAGRGASAFSGGIIRLYDPDPVLRDFAHRAVTIRRDHPIGRLFSEAIRTTGVVYRDFAENAEALEEAMRPFREAGYPSHRLAAGKIGALTGFAGDRDDTVDLFEPQGGHSDVRRASQVMAGVVRESGAVLEHASVAALHARDDGGADVVLANGAVLGCRVVVVATGGWASRLLPEAAVVAKTIPLARIEIAAAPKMPVIDIVEGTYAVPCGETVVGVGCGLRSGAPTPDGLPAPSRAHVADAEARLAALTGGRLDGRVIDVLPGFDSYAPDGRPVLGFVADGSPVYVASGFCGIGFKLAPAAAEQALAALSQRLGGDAPDAFPAAHAFAPSRFSPPSHIDRQRGS